MDTSLNTVHGIHILLLDDLGNESVGVPIELARRGQYWKRWRFSRNAHLLLADIYMNIPFQNMSGGNKPLHVCPVLGQWQYGPPPKVTLQSKSPMEDFNDFCQTIMTMG